LTYTEMKEINTLQMNIPFVHYFPGLSAFKNYAEI